VRHLFVPSPPVPREPSPYSIAHRRCQLSYRAITTIPGSRAPFPLFKRYRGGRFQSCFRQFPICLTTVSSLPCRCRIPQVPYRNVTTCAPPVLAVPLSPPLPPVPHMHARPSSSSLISSLFHFRRRLPSGNVTWPWFSWLRDDPFLLTH
jgi:hypothetical protein